MLIFLFHGTSLGSSFSSFTMFLPPSFSAPLSMVGGGVTMVSKLYDGDSVPGEVLWRIPLIDELNIGDQIEFEAFV